MKKALLFFLSLALCIGAQAQVSIGGTLGVDVTKVTTETNGNSISAKQTIFEITPEACYRFNKVLTVGLQAAFGIVSVEEESFNCFRIMPYVRATFARANIVDFFCEAAAGYAHQTAEHYNTSGTVVELRPGIAINVSPKFAIIARTNLLQYEKLENNHGIEFSINKGLDLGVQFAF